MQTDTKRSGPSQRRNAEMALNRNLYDERIRSVKKHTTRKKTSTQGEEVRLRTIPIIGTVGDDGIKLKPEYETKIAGPGELPSNPTPTKEEIARAKHEAQAVATFIESEGPDELRRVQKGLEVGSHA